MIANASQSPGLLIGLQPAEMSCRLVVGFDQKWWVSHDVHAHGNGILNKYVYIYIQYMYWRIITSWSALAIVTIVKDHMKQDETGTLYGDHRTWLANKVKARDTGIPSKKQSLATGCPLPLPQRPVLHVPATRLVLGDVATGLTQPLWAPCGPPIPVGLFTGIALICTVRYLELILLMHCSKAFIHAQTCINTCDTEYTL